MDQEQKKICCPEFDPATLHEKTHIWNNKLFITDNVRQLFHVPVNMGKIVVKMMKQIEGAGAMPDAKDFFDARL